MKIDWEEVKVKADAGILEVERAAAAGGGEEKLEAVVDKIMDWLDEKVSFKGPLAGIGEMVSDFLLGLIRGAVKSEVQHRFDALRKAGEV